MTKESHYIVQCRGISSPNPENWFDIFGEILTIAEAEAQMERHYQINKSCEYRVIKKTIEIEVLRFGEFNG